MARSSGTFKKGVKVPGQGKRGPDKATLAAREAIGKFVDGNAHRLQTWLDQVADGVPKVDEEGNAIKGEYIVNPDPKKAAELFQSVIEYHVPKLARQEHVGGDGGAIKTEGKWTVEIVNAKS